MLSSPMFDGWDLGQHVKLQDPTKAGGFDATQRYSVVNLAQRNEGSAFKL
jgi:hypothetical protein